ncbi:MAG TPA: folylpolyglutamate synthase/dihydrofolate synthase family protein [Myxococcota bacterium]|nr:folylpolyglutamate synthase/dihydrofolate synthase family protein [Myxococcota bacterium]
MRSGRGASLRTLAQAAAYLEGLIDRERRPDYDYARLDLRPIRALLDRLGRPETRLSVVHVAGSKGKGSTCLFVEAILGALGERVGTFTSPHLESWVERFRIDGVPVSEPRLVAAVERVRPIVDVLREGPRETRPSFFDATTAIAFLLFDEAGVDRAVIEVGLGGRLDSTNVVDPAVTCITSIELEHTDKLGDTEALIAAEKAGILKPGRPVVVGALRPEAAAVVRARAAAVGAPLRVLGEHFTVHARGDGSSPITHVFEAQGSSGGAPFVAPFALRVAGRVAAGNAALAIDCVRALGVHPEPALVRAIEVGLGCASLPARIEVLAADPEVIVDAAHTAHSARALAEALEALAPDGYVLVLSVSSDKKLDAVLEAVLARATRVWVTRSEPTRSLAPALLAGRVRAHTPDLPIEIVEDAEDALRRAREALPEGERLCAAGSVYLAGIARRVLGRPTARPAPPTSPAPTR